jgi:hypothetical protein
MFAKIKVNGADADPLYACLKDARPGVLGLEAINMRRLGPSGPRVEVGMRSVNG